MKVVQINATCEKGSTGKICVSISKILSKKNIENYIFYSLNTTNYPLAIKCSNEKYIKFQALKAKILGNYGFNSRIATELIIKKIKKIKPDIVHLHNIHGHDCHLERLLSYLKKENVKVFWTFHDCWAFTGYCTHFTEIQCEKWMNGCEKCPQYKKYSWFRDQSEILYKRKKRIVENMDLTIITPSEWLKTIVKSSFMKQHPVVVINNGIDLSVFKYYDVLFRTVHEINEDVCIVLGVAHTWCESKGLDVFCELAKKLDKSKYQIILVGTDDKVEKYLPNEIIAIRRTDNQTELAKIYSAADVFVNCTREDNFPTVNIEALACGTPVITFETGGSPEIIDESSGVVVKCDDVEALIREISKIKKNKEYTREKCRERASLFNEKETFEKYAELYMRE